MPQIDYHQESGLANQSLSRGLSKVEAQVQNHPSIWKEETRSPKVGKFEHFLTTF